MSEPIRYTYRFEFDDRTEKTFELVLNPTTLELLPPSLPSKPDWSKLKFHQCENCPLGEEVEYCPVAVNLTHIVEKFKDRESIEQALVTVEVSERKYQNHLDVQKGLGSLIGVVMVTSNCPVLDNLRPMVRFHLPFASGHETVYRAVSMYLVEQYFRMKDGENPDWNLEGFSKMYKEVFHVNQKMRERLQGASEPNSDANTNAIIYLASLGQLLEMDLDSVNHRIEELRYLFVR